MMRSLLCIMLLLAAALLAQADSLYVVNTLSNDVTLLDSATQQTTATIPLNASGYRMTLSPDKLRGYITAMQSAQQPEEQAGQLIVLDLTNNTVVQRIAPLPLAPLCSVHILPDGVRALLVTAGSPGARNEERGQVHQLNLATGAIDASLRVGLNPLASVMTPDGTKLYTADWASHAISVVDAQQMRLLDTIPLGAATARTLAMAPDGSKVYTALEAATTNQTVQFNSIRTPMGHTNNYVNANSRAGNLTAQTFSLRAQWAEEERLWQIDTATGKIDKYPLGDITTIYTLAVAPDGQHVYAYGLQTPADPAQQREAVYSLLALDMTDQGKITNFGNFGYLSSLVVSADGSRLYLIGTPGEVTKEAAMQENFNAALNSRGQQQQNTGIDPQLAHDLLENMRHINKTVTIVDAKTGARVGTVTVGSLPQDACLVPNTP